MKKGLLLSLLFIVAVALSACNNNNRNSLGATVDVTVNNLLGTHQDGETVYLFIGNEPNDSSRKVDAKKQALTNENGVAHFDLNFMDLNITETETPLYFVVYYTSNGTSRVAGSTAVNLRRGEHKDVKVVVPL